MSPTANQRTLRAAVWALADIDADERTVSRAIDAFGQVLADLTDTPLRLVIVSGEAFEENNELRAEVARLKLLLNKAYGPILPGFDVETLTLCHPAFDGPLHLCTGDTDIVVDGVKFTATDLVTK